MSVDEFGGVGFAAGVVRGTRAFAVDKLGRLTGVTFPQVWVPGENQAECHRVDVDYTAMLRAMVRTFSEFPPAPTYTPRQSGKRSWLDTIVGAPSVVERTVEDAKRRAYEAEKARIAEEEARVRADRLEDCKHGFYGYYDGSNDYYQHGRVMGVIEGYGETIVGTRGFRCMKARIVAIRIPKHVPDRLRTLVLRNYQGIPVFDSFKRMVAEFPPDSAGLAVSPDTDPEFWTRQV